MRLIVGVLTCLSLGALAPAFANDPAPVAATAPAAPTAPASGASTPTSSTPSSSVAPSTTPGSAQSASASQAASPGQPASQIPPAAAAATTTAAGKSKKPELTPAEKDLLAQGYKLEMRGTEKHFCRSQAELGTRFTHRVCITAEQVAVTKRSSQDFLNDVQRPSGNTPGK